MLQKMKVKKEKGFTLIELMIVIAIIGILAAIAVPQFLAYRIRSYNTGAKAIVHNLKADQSNLNAELGVYGHTEAVEAQLDDADVGVGVADSNNTPALRIGATATTDGARISGVHPTTLRELSIGISLGDNMVAYSIDSGGDPSAHYSVARHFRGDTAYGIDSDIENQIYAVSNPNWCDLAGLQATLPTSCTLSADDFDGQPGGGAPTANWMSGT